MSDEFLARYRERPDPKFSEELRERISHRRTSVLAIRLNRASLAAAAALVILAAALGVSPAARAAAEAALRQIANLRFLEVAELPRDAWVTRKTDVVPAEALNVQDALDRLGHPVSLPTYVPAGYELQPQARLVAAADELSPSVVFVDWRSGQGTNAAWLTLKIAYRASPPEGTEHGAWVVGEGAVEEAEVAGNPAALVRGAWAVDTGEYLMGDPLSLTWSRDGQLVYTLYGSASALSVEEMIAIAESIR